MKCVILLFFIVLCSLVADYEAMPCNINPNANKPIKGKEINVVDLLKTKVKKAEKYVRQDDKLDGILATTTDGHQYLIYRAKKRVVVTNKNNGLSIFMRLQGWKGTGQEEKLGKESTIESLFQRIEN